jgi:isoleucyl-tRNA synthetase
VAPILTFTSDEVWQYLPAASDKPESVHLAPFPVADNLGAADESLLQDWRELLALRDQVLLKLEDLRKEKTIGKSLEAKVNIAARGGLLDTLRLAEPGLKELFNVSQVSLQPMSDVSGHAAATIAIGAAEGHKCDRCWNYYADDSPQHVRQFGRWPNVCGRCADALREMGYSEDAQ